jgi:hypothetical protein
MHYSTTLRIKTSAVSAALLMTACGNTGQPDVAVDGLSGTRQSSESPDHAQAREMCHDQGFARANDLGNVEAVAAVFKSTAEQVAEWQRSNSGIEGRSGSSWSDERQDQLTAVCYYDATDIMAPAGPPPPDASAPPPYDQLVIIVGEDGTDQPYMALRDGQSREPTGPQGSERVDTP